MENSPLQGLLNCLKEIPTHLSDMQGDRGQTRLEMETRAWQATGELKGVSTALYKTGSVSRGVGCLSPCSGSD